ncbi:response regulator transcription factor [bacterium SCSIO 12741]|nr:response regulator transcription factor [bacterium SCSIO 12741]
MLKVVLVDDHKLVTEGFKKIIDSSPGFEVIEIFNNPKQALINIPTLAPDIVVTDFEMPEINGIDFIDSLRQYLPNFKSIVLSMHLSSSLLSMVKEQNIQGYLPKSTDEFELMQCLEAVKAGRNFYSQEVLNNTLAETHQLKTISDKNKKYQLSKREQEILERVVDGLGTKQIADQLNLSPRTVETHRKNIMEKLDVNSVASLVRVAITEGLIQ